MAEIWSEKVRCSSEAKVASTVSGDKWGVVYLVKLLSESNEWEFSLGGIESYEIGSHPGRDLLKGILQVGDAWVEVGRVKWEKQSA